MEWFSLVAVAFALGVPAWLVAEEILRHRQSPVTDPGVQTQTKRTAAPGVPDRRAA